MTAPRIPETEATLDGREHVAAYARMQRELARRGWLETDELLRAGIDRGVALEVGAGPGLLGLDWLARTEGTRLVGVDTSAEMLAVAEGHAAERGLGARARFVLASVEALPLPDGAFDAAFSSRSLHEWRAPRDALGELWRVLAPGGRLYLSDLRRDVADKGRAFLERRMTCEVVLAGLRASLDAAYTADEVRALFAATPFAAADVRATPIDLRVLARKPAREEAP